MKNVKKSWIALLLGALLLAILVGVVWARPKRHHGGFHYTITIPAAAFIPVNDSLNWDNWGNFIEINSGSDYFTAAVPILPGRRTVESLTLYAWDSSGSNNVCADLYRQKPSDGTYTQMASVCSSGAAGGSRTFTTTTISPSTIWGGHGAYLDLNFPAALELGVYAVQIGYY